MIHVAQIQSILSNHKQEFLDLGVKELFLFGSVARGSNSQNSDIDFMVRFASGEKTFDNFMDLSFKLENLFKTHLDLLTEELLTESFRNSIEQELIRNEF